MENSIIIFNLSENFEKFQNNEESFKCFLIQTKSIPNFMKIIEESKILDNISNDKYNKCLNNFKDLLVNYKIEKTLEEVTYDKWKFMLNSKDEKENEFILVNETFMTYMGLKHNLVSGICQDMLVYKDYIFANFTNSKNNALYYKQKKCGIYKFISLENISNQKHHLIFGC